MENGIRIALTFGSNLFNEKTQAILTQTKHNEHTVSLYIRRGGYLEPKHWKTIDSVCQLSYYLNAITEMNKRIEQPSYHVFSGDIAWVKENLPLPQAVPADQNEGTESWQDMMLMSHCRHHIICDSTFNWWGAWLDPREDKTVTMPERWFQHCDMPNIYSVGWIKIPVN